jgi:pimeloyl-ACP methyl ester carboxylesterase
MPHLDLADRRIYYRVDGHGPWLVLVHGLSQNHMVWSGQLAALAQEYRSVRIDLRGHGFSSAPPSGYGQVEYLDDVLAVLDHLGIARTYWWGTHTGAAVGLLLAALHPERVAALVLDGAVIPGIAPPSVERHNAWARDLASSAGVQRVLEEWFERGEWFAGLHANPVRRRMLAHKDLVLAFSGAPWLTDVAPLPVPPVAERLHEIRQPTLVMNGTEDLPDFLEVAARLERALPNATRYLIPGAGAFPFWEEPDAVTPAVLSYLGELG